MRLRTLALLVVATAPLLAPASPPRGRPEASDSRQLQLRLRGAASAREQRAPRVELVSQRRIAGPPARERRPELSAQQLILVLRGAANEEIARVTVPDPRIVRAEFPGPTGELSSTVVVREDVEFPVLVPDHPGTRRVEVLKPEWTGARFVLVPVGSAEVP